MSKKKLTILIDWYLPGTKAGGPVRSIHSLVQLLKSELDISIITTNTDLGSQTPYPSLKSNCWVDQDGIKVYYFSKEQLTKTNLQNIIKESSCDLLYLNSFWSYWFSIVPVQLKNSQAIDSPIVLAPRGMLGKGALSIKSFKKKIYLLISKIRGFYNRIEFHATNEQEHSDIIKQFSSAVIQIIPNVSGAAPVSIQKTKTENKLDLFFLSRISRVKNLHFALNVLKQVSSNYSINYTIYGNIENAAYWDECKKIIEQLPSHIQVTYKGELAFDQIQNTIGKHHYLFMPTLNENFGHSIVESLMSACPVIISDQTPWNDVPGSNAGYAIPLSDEKQFIKIIELAASENNETYQKRTNAAVSYMSEKLNLSLIKQKYLKLFHAKH